MQDDNLLMLMINFVVNKAKRRISKRVFQENQARQIFRKTKISYHLIRTRTCAYQGVRNVRFSENLTWFIFLKYPFWDSPFCLVTDECLFSKQKKVLWRSCKASPANIYLCKINNRNIRKRCGISLEFNF